MFSRTFDQPFNLLITSTECSPIVYLLSNSLNELCISFKSRVTVSIDYLDDVSDSSNLIRPKNTRKVNDHIIGTSTVNRCNFDQETCSSLKFDKLDCLSSNSVSVFPTLWTEKNSSSLSATSANSCSGKHLLESHFDAAHAFDYQLDKKESLNSKVKDTRDYVAGENQKSIAASSSSELTSGPDKRSTLKDISGATKTDSNEDSESEIELDWDSAPTSSDPFTSSDDETVTKRRSENTTRKTLRHDRQNYVDYLLKIMAGVHGLKLPDSAANETSNGSVQIYSEKNVTESKIEFVHRYAPCLEQNNQSDSLLLNADDSDDDPFPFNRTSSLQTIKHDLLPFTSPLANGPHLTLDLGNRQEKDFQDPINSHDSAHDNISCLKHKNAKLVHDLFPAVVTHDLSADNVPIPLISPQPVNTFIGSSLDSNFQDWEKRKKSQRPEESKVQNFNLQKRKQDFDKMTNRNNFKRKRLNLNLQLSLFKDQMTKLNERFGIILESIKGEENETCQLPVDTKLLFSGTCDNSNITDKDNQLTGRDINSQTEIPSVDPFAPTEVKDNSAKIKKDELNYRKAPKVSASYLRETINGHSVSTISIPKELNLNNTKTLKVKKKLIESTEEPKIVKTVTSIKDARLPRIEKILTRAELEESIKAIYAERHRMERLMKQEKIFNQLRPKMNKKRLILDFDANGKVRVEVDNVFLGALKDHQREGIKFMYNSTIENVDKLKEGDEGSGCILAHCMGLGKTFQAIAFAHTILSSPSTREYIKTVLIAVPDDVLKHWRQELKKWIKVRRLRIFRVFEIQNESKHHIDLLNFWHTKGGVLIIGHSLLGSLFAKSKNSPSDKLALRHLDDPGPDIIIIDGGHTLRSSSLMSKCIVEMKTRRKILLSGKIVQNDTVEYYSMVDIIKPRLLGTSRFFADQFQIPIEKGKRVHPASKDVQLMKERQSILEQLVSGSIQMYNFDTLRSVVPTKLEFVLYLRPTEIISKMYNYFIDHFCKEKHLLNHSDCLRLCLNHPVLYYKMEQNVAFREKTPNEEIFEKDWYKMFLPYSYDSQKIERSCKFVMFYRILSKCISIGDKLVVVSQSIETLNLIESHLERFEEHYGNWKNPLKWIHGKNYFRIDYTKQTERKHEQIERFNNPANREARLFLLSARAGGIGIDLHGANRMIIFDVSLNPSDDIQAICRLYRMGQTKSVYVYRFVTKDTMEEVMFRKQIDKLEADIRGLDQQRVEKIFTTSELNEFYDIRPSSCYKIPFIAKSHSDSLLDEILSKKNKQILKYVEFDSLLEKNLEHSGESERRLAWKVMKCSSDAEFVDSDIESLFSD